MGKTFLTIFILTLCSAFIVMAEKVDITSLDKNITLSINIQNRISWTVTYKNKIVIEEATISMLLNNKQEFGINPKIKNKSILIKDNNISAIVPNKDVQITEEYKELILQFKGNYSLTFRIYNEGVAYQFSSKLDGELIINSEIMNIRFPENSISYFPKEESMYSHYERYYLKKRLDSINDSEFCSLPVLFNTANNIKIFFSEAGLQDYPCMFLEGNKDFSLHAVFPKFVLKTEPNTRKSPDRHEIISHEADYIAKTKGNRDFPWRVFIISDDDRKLVESNLIFQLSQPIAIKNTDWIKPGKVAWDWYNANNIFGVDFKSGLNTETYKYYIDFASANNIEYVILDEGWTKSTTDLLNFNPEINVPKLIDYGKSKNVGLILWTLWKPLNENIQEILKTYHDWGAKGIKVDFMQRADQYMVNSYEEIAKIAAKNELLVNFHGAFKPAGLRRKYPNVLSYEGVKGNENNKWSDGITPEHNVTIPFIRMVAGPMDYTPGAMRNANRNNFGIHFERPMSLGTRCHQVAMYIVYESPLQMLCENPSIYYKEQETLSFISQIPSVWDETIVLEGQVADYIVVARRKGDNWYIGAMTDWEAREFEIDFSFLQKGEYKTEIIKDGINADRFAEDYKKDIKIISESSKLKIKLASGGGWAAILNYTKRKIR